MPREDRLPILPDISHSELVTLRRGFLSKTMKLLEPVMLGGVVKPNLDDAITAFLLHNIGPSENEFVASSPELSTTYKSRTEALLTNWLSFQKFMIKDMGCHFRQEGMDEEDREEWRRYIPSTAINPYSNCRVVFGGPHISSIDTRPYRSIRVLNYPIWNVSIWNSHVQTMFGSLIRVCTHT